MAHVVEGEAAVRVADGDAEELVAVLAVDVEAQRVADCLPGVALADVHPVDGTNLAAPGHAPVPPHVRQGEVELDLLQLADVADGELNEELGVPVDGVDGRPHGGVALALGDVVAHGQVDHLATREVPQGHCKAHLGRNRPRRTGPPGLWEDGWGAGGGGDL